ncbi:hydroxyisourate hydrolase [Nitratireductor sp. ZSWI3]|uniref:hydroxyisourate hydrolase n=1 Tax=Nitratireductor sp. ZSWI3 TaxID=2966359 RepID=UPI00214FC23E|nr:hydroxyisourate hydrolase [Nitratireductor sp. ZSWI3]MCR4265614.1 hydroxyisourate hydrolase [Nitratireductor sp. ZSWI3]
MNITKVNLIAIASAASIFSSDVLAQEFSTHVLDVARGTGGRDIPVTLMQQQKDGSWTQIAAARTDDNGRVRSFGEETQVEAATYKLTFDMSNYPDPGNARFFPMIDVVFQVTDPSVPYHVPIVVSPYGYSTYRGN